MLGNHSQNLGCKPLERRNASAARLRRSAVMVAPALQPLDCRCYAHLKTLCRLTPRCARSHRLDNAFPQVTRIGLLAPARKENQCTKSLSSLTVWESLRFKWDGNRFSEPRLRKFKPGLPDSSGLIADALHPVFAAPEVSVSVIVRRRFPLHVPRIRIREVQ